jgi:hypothetical protein
MRFDARRAFPEGPDAFIRPVAFFALIGVMVVFAEVSPPSVQLAVAGVGLFVFGSIALMVIAKRLLADTRISSAIVRLLPLLWVCSRQPGPPSVRTGVRTRGLGPLSSS